ncbi:2249_t:CDS:2 [Paraglomus occultum]|uniref:2249_t:CDS:1 n=1 Tax=Paraglomus occultum TaxID=144539 RepID=A0A9N8WP09_9GLOM|nr:2249_t:CDS:2 [Paraglomus occultum]
MQEANKFAYYDLNDSRKAFAYYGVNDCGKVGKLSEQLHFNLLITHQSSTFSSTNVPSSDVGKTNKIFVIEIIGGLGGLSGLLFCLAKWTAIVDSIA